MVKTDFGRLLHKALNGEYLIQYNPQILSIQNRLNGGNSNLGWHKNILLKLKAGVYKHHLNFFHLASGSSEPSMILYVTSNASHLV